MRTFSGVFNLFTAKAANGVSKAMKVTDYRHVVIQLASASSASLTVKIQGSLSETAPDFSAAASATNAWAYLDLVDLATNSVLAGATGVAYSGTDAVRMVEVNTNGMTWVSAELSSYSAGNINVDARGFDNS